MKTGVVEMQLGQAITQVFELPGIDREQPAKHHRHRRLEPGQGFVCGALVLGDGVADLGIGHGLDGGGDKTDFAGAEFADIDRLRREITDLFDLIGGARRHHPDFSAFFQHTVLDPDQDHHAQVGIVPAIDQQRLQGRVGIAGGRRQVRDQGFQHGIDAQPGLRRNFQRLGNVETDHLFDLLFNTIRFGGGQVDLVQHRHDFMIRVDRQIGIGQGLRLHPLGRVDHQHRALARRQRSTDLIGEIDMAGGVHEVELIGLAVGRLILQSHRLRLDGDAALALQFHGIKHLLRHFPVR